MSEKVQSSEVKAGPPAEAPKVLCVFHARVKAHSGKGIVTAVVQDSDGTCFLHGSTNLAKGGFLPMSYYQKFVLPAPLARLLGNVPVITGAAACKKWLVDNAVKGIDAVDIHGDALMGRVPATDRGSTTCGLQGSSVK